MPEGDTVWRTARRLNQVFAGAELTVCDLRWPGLSTLALGGTTRQVIPRGKHILHRLDTGWTIHSHLRMEGSWRIERAGPPPPPSTKLRAVLGTVDYLALGWSLGMLDVLATGDEHSVVGHLGPDLLGPDWDADLAVGHLRASPDALGAALLDQRNLAGLGTMWMAESLFAARLNPFTPAREHGDAELRGLVSRAQRMLRASCADSSPTSPGHGRLPNAVHGRHHRPCRRCGTPIATASIGPPIRERIVYFCPRCQGVTASRP